MPVCIFILCFFSRELKAAAATAVVPSAFPSFLHQVEEAARRFQCKEVSSSSGKEWWCSENIKAILHRTACLHPVLVSSMHRCTIPCRIYRISED